MQDLISETIKKGWKTRLSTNRALDFYNYPDSQSQDAATRWSMSGRERNAIIFKSNDCTYCRINSFQEIDESSMTTNPAKNSSAHCALFHTVRGDRRRGKEKTHRWVSHRRWRFMHNTAKKWWGLPFPRGIICSPCQRNRRAHLCFQLLIHFFVLESILDPWTSVGSTLVQS